MRRFEFTRYLLSAILLLTVTACVNVGGRMAEALSNSVLNQRDPVTVRDGLPAYLLLLDGMIRDDPHNPSMLLAGARLYGAYAGAFVNEPARAQLMSTTALDYAQRALCLELKSLCAGLGQPMDQFNQILGTLNKKSDVPLLYSYAVAWAGWIQANSGDWKAIADVPKVEAIMRKVLQLEEGYEQGSAHLYMGVLLCLRPASLGGQPEQGKEHFERALELSNGHNLMVKVLYARHYARLVFDQSLHDRLLQDVLVAGVEYPDLTLMNVLAQTQAKALLESSNDYF
ncbi:MAG: TRAP transporter TatT component family protein [Gammaproteobacteria bacterium]|nr:TRAP transporter TatT component family protein [Gammaproteobacteria bacterium]